MLTLAIIIAGACLGGRGPAYLDWRAKKKLERDYRARALTKYLPSAACRGLSP